MRRSLYWCDARQAEIDKEAFWFLKRIRKICVSLSNKEVLVYCLNLKQIIST